MLFEFISIIIFSKEKKNDVGRKRNVVCEDTGFTIRSVKYMVLINMKKYNRYILQTHHVSGVVSCRDISCLSSVNIKVGTKV